MIVASLFCKTTTWVWKRCKLERKTEKHSGHFGKWPSFVFNDSHKNAQIPNYHQIIAQMLKQINKYTG